MPKITKTATSKSDNKNDTNGSKPTHKSASMTMTSSTNLPKPPPPAAAAPIVVVSHNGNTLATPMATTTATTKKKVTTPRAKRALPGTQKRSVKKPRSSSSDSYHHNSSNSASIKSTTTTTTATARTPVNVYDAVLGEAQDLLKAAMEAQALGRLKMASAYQLLLHARLVGLGKRFDRAEICGNDTTTISMAAGSDKVLESNTGNGRALSPVLHALSHTGKSTSTIATPSTRATTTMTTSTTPATPAVQELAKYIPPNIELDSAMMEHLARAAMELHHQRTGRRIHSDTVGVSPMTAAAASTTTTSTGIAWTEDEMNQVQTLLRQGTTDVAVIANMLGSRTETQVRAYLRNATERQKGTQAVEQEMEEESPRRRGGRGKKPPTQAMNTVPNANLDARALLAGKGL